MYEGEFFNDKFHGKGVWFSNASGTSKMGMWANGNLIQQHQF
jgi:hypothetical protein